MDDTMIPVPLNWSILQSSWLGVSYGILVQLASVSDYKFIILLFVKEHSFLYYSPDT